MVASIKLVSIVFVIFTLVSKAICAQEILSIEVDGSSSGAISVPSNLELQRLGIPLDSGYPQEIQKYKSHSLGFGSLVDWEIADEAKELGISSDIVRALNKALELRRQTHEKCFEDLKHGLSQIKESGNEKDATSRTQAIVNEYLKRDSQKENDLITVLDELLPPEQYTALMRFLIKKNWQAIGGSPVLCDFLKLTEKQIAAFEKARQSEVNAHKYVDLLVAAEASLDKAQTEEYWIATGRMPSNVTLETFFSDLPPARQAELRKHYIIFRQLSDGARSISGHLRSGVQVVE